MLVSSNGYNYLLKTDKRPGVTRIWRCMYRNHREFKCYGQVIEKSNVYKPGKHPHTCTPCEYLIHITREFLEKCTVYILMYVAC